MISNIQVASAEGLRSRTRWTRTVDDDPNGAPNVVSLRRAQFYLFDYTHLSLPKMLSGANAFEMNDIERMNIGARQPGVWHVTMLHALWLPEITIRQGHPTAQLKRGMKMEEVTSLLGPGKRLFESAGDGGLKTQVFEYLTDDRRVEVT